MKKRKKLLIIFGAGSSVSLGLPSVRQLDNLMLGWARSLGVYDNERYRADFFRLAWDAIEAHLEGRWALVQDEGPNYEKALGLMAQLANWVKPRPHGQALSNLVGGGDALPAFFDQCRLAEISLDDFGASCVVKTSYVELLIRLASYIREQCRSLQESHKRKFENYKRILDALQERFDIGILSLNYDDVALQAWPEAFCGFSDRVDDTGCRSFDPVEVHARTHFGFIYHLHGSVHHTLHGFGARSIFEDRVLWRDDLNGTFEDGTPYGSSIMDERSDGNDIPASTLIAGALKLDQLLGDPFQTLYAALQRHVHEADAILIGGYGFGDVHVNRLLLSRMTNPGGSQPNVMILEWTRDDRPTMFSRYDGWPRRMRTALAVGPQSFDVIPGTVSSIKKRCWFETAGNRIAIWHNGFLEASERLDCILNFLDGDNAALDGVRVARMSRAVSG